MKRLAAALALLLLASCSSHDGVRRVSGTPTPLQSASTPASPAAAPTATRGPATAFVEPPGGSLPESFVPVSATFVSDRTGWVLGCAGTCSDEGNPLAVLRTHDAGRSWARLPAPPVDHDAVFGLRFANVRDGFAYGPGGVWITHDGAATWQQSPVPGRVQALEAAHGEVWVLDDEAQVWRGTAAEVALTRVAEPATDDVLLLHGDSAFGSVYAGHGRSLLTFVDPTHRAGRAGLPCTDDGDPLLAPRTSRAIFLVCADDGGRGDGSRSAWFTSDRGSSWHRLVQPPSVGMRSLVAATPRSLFIASDGQLLASHDGGRTWRSPVEIDGLVDLGFEGPRLGFVIDRLDDAVMRITRDDGRSWRRVDFRRTAPS